MRPSFGIECNDPPSQRVSRVYLVRAPTFSHHSIWQVTTTVRNQYRYPSECRVSVDLAASARITIIIPRSQPLVVDLEPTTQRTQVGPVASFYIPSTHASIGTLYGRRELALQRETVAYSRLFLRHRLRHNGQHRFRGNEQYDRYWSFRR
jgi:hypothetical protein